ncbi:MAG TPA: universal stress protein [Caldilineaceae bacterium]|nr:universal stress protein [Caldilineaceae bacterium]
MFTHILALLDGSTLAECILPHVVAFSRAFDARVTIVHVVADTQSDEEATIDPLQWEMQKTEAQVYLDEIARRLHSEGVVAATVLLEGRVAESIGDFAKQEDVDLLVLSTHGQSGLSRWNVSSVAYKVVTNAPTSLLLIRAYQPQRVELSAMRYAQILAPLDGSQRAECILPDIETLAEQHDGSILLVHVVRCPEIPRHVPLSTEEQDLYDRVTALNHSVADEYLEEQQKRLSLNSAIDSEVQILESDDVAAALHELATTVNADLVVLGAHGYSGSRKWPYGSVATSFITYGSHPLLIVQDIAAEEIDPTPAQRAAREKAGH